MKKTSNIVDWIPHLAFILLFVALFASAKDAREKEEAFNQQYPVINRTIVEKIHRPSSTSRVPISTGKSTTYVNSTSDERFILKIQGFQKDKEVWSKVQVDKATFDSYQIGDKLKKVYIKDESSYKDLTKEE